MTTFYENESEPLKVTESLRRDWILLPIVGLLTVFLILCLTELIARRVFPQSKQGLGSCLVITDPSTGAQGIPNSRCTEKIFENPRQVDYLFNSCGHRAGMECGPKSERAYRIVMTGTSFAIGARVQREDSFAALLPMELSRLTKRKVELYNEGMASRNVLGVARHFDEVLAADPDMVLWVLTPWELSNPQFQISAPSAGPITSELGSMKRTFATESIPDAFRDLSPQLLAFFLQHARSIQVLQHYLYQSRSLYVRSYLMKGEDETGFLRAEPGSRWKGYLQQLDTNAAEIGKRAKAAGVPLVVVLLPNRAQAAMISMRESPKGYDPYELGNELRAIVERNGGTYIDILDGFRALPNSEQYYFPIDGHPDVDGHRIISGLLANALTSGTVPALRSLVQQRASLEQK